MFIGIYKSKNYFYRGPDTHSENFIGVQRFLEEHDSFYHFYYRIFLQACLDKPAREGPDFMKDRAHLTRTLEEGEERVEKGILKNTTLRDDSSKNREELHKLLQPTNSAVALGQSPRETVRKDQGKLSDIFSRYVQLLKIEKLNECS